MKGWSITQSVIALSSGEADYYGMVKGASVALGVRSVLNDMGVRKTIRLSTDASAAKGIASRKGLGKVRHIEVNQLWLQDKVASGGLDVVKVQGSENIADALTKYVTASEVRRHVIATGQGFSEGRHALMPSA